MKNTKKFASEVELADAVARWAEAHGWEVWKEVSTRDGDIDLLLTQGRTMWIVETKLRLSHEVLEQAYRRLSYAHYVSVAVPSLPSGKDASMVNQHFMESFGIGLIEVGHPDNHRWTRRVTQLANEGRLTTMIPAAEPDWAHVCREEIRPKVWRPNDLSVWIPWERNAAKLSFRRIRAKRMAELRAFLRPEHKTLVAGAKNGSQLTPWKITFIEVQRFLRERGPSTIKEIVAGCKAVTDYYRTDRLAKAGLARMIEIKAKEFVKTEVDGETKWSVR